MAVPLTLSSVPAQTPYVQYVSSSGQTVFPYPFEITQDSDLVCLINGAQQATDSGYTLSGQGTTVGGNLTFTVGQTAGTIITLYRNISIARITQLSQAGTFFSANFNNEYNRIYLIMQQLQQSLLPGGNQAYALMVPNSNNPAPTTLLTPANYANKYLSFDANGNPTPAVLTTSGSLTASIIAGLLNGAPQTIQINIGQTAAEAAVSAVVVNAQYLPGRVDRYGTNTTPGTTAMQAAFNAAVAQCMAGGAKVTYGDTAPYRLTAPVNCTFGSTANQHGLTIENISGATSDSPDYGIIASYTSKNSVFDCTGNDAATFINVSIDSTNATGPKVGILTARNSHGGSLIFRATNIKVYGNFSVAPYYNFGSEDDVLVACEFTNTSTAAGTKTRVYTSNNISSIASDFTTDPLGNTVSIYGSAASCIEHNDFGCLDYNQAGTATSDCIYIEASDSVKKYGGWAYNASASANGRALVYVDMTNSSSNYGSINGLTGEESAGFKQAYGLLFSNNAFTPLGWSVTDTKLPSATAAISAGSSVTLDNFALRNVTANASVNIAIAGTLQNSPTFDYGGENTITIGTSIRNRLTGDTGKLTVTTRTNDYWIDTGTTNKTWAPDIVSGTNNFTAVGAITQRARCLFTGNKVDFELLLCGATSIAWTTGATIANLPATAVDTGVCTIVDAMAGTVIGMGTIAGTTITMVAAQTATAHSMIISGSYFVAS